jgi:hypothetical protein
MEKVVYYETNFSINTLLEVGIVGDFFYSPSLTSDALARISNLLILSLSAFMKNE